MIVFVHQPEYIPWMGFFDKLARCDVFVIYDDAQYVHGGYHNRNRIRTCKGWRWITIPIVHNHPQMIKDVRISGTRWRKDHTRIISQHYEKAPYFKTYFPLIEEALNFNHELLIGLNLHLLKNIAEALGLKAKMIRSSEFPYHGIDKNEKLISMCKLLVQTRIFLAAAVEATLMRKLSLIQTLSYKCTTICIQLINNILKALNQTCQLLTYFLILDLKQKK
jgi:hypothetical protein